MYIICLSYGSLPFQGGIILAVQIPIVIPNPSLITWCVHCGSASVGKAIVEPEILKKLGAKCKKHEWQAMAPFNGVHGNHVQQRIPTVEMKAPQDDAPTCTICFSLTRRNGSCYICPDCGTTTGCS